MAQGYTAGLDLTICKSSVFYPMSSLFFQILIATSRCTLLSMSQGDMPLVLAPAKATWQGTIAKKGLIAMPQMLLI